MKFTYRWGQRPLDGYTIKRGLGQGGFGEVYFAVSDGGKEVALKLLTRGRTDTELRGISTCLNLKHQHLVHVYDLRTDGKGDHWLVMEYVHGESLASILQKHPTGLSVDVVKKWFLQTAQAVSYLHDHAVIHRDIKPGNIFLENGEVKLGDYGLSKTIVSTSLDHSVNVGTIYYMAPEMGRGTCTKQADIYSCGVMLYEMLTGELPFSGQSFTEVAMRHQTELPEMTKIPAEYLPIIAKALQKRPEDRYQNMEQMIREINAIGTIEYSILPAMQDAPQTKPATEAKPKPLQQTPPLPKERQNVVVSATSTTTTSATLERLSTWTLVKARLAEISRSMAAAPIAAGGVVLTWLIVSVIFTRNIPWDELIPLGGLTVLLSWAVILTAKFFSSQKGEGSWRMAGVGAIMGLAAFWLDGWTFPKLIEEGQQVATEQAYLGGSLQASQGTMEHLIGYPLTYGIIFGLTHWGAFMKRHRKERFSLGPVFAVGFYAFMTWILGWRLMISGDSPPSFIFLATAGSAAVVQMVSSWAAPPPPIPKRRRIHR
ncbi:MAG: serine/threonine-protein kinase [Zavarzinella sp.]